MKKIIFYLITIIYSFVCIDSAYAEIIKVELKTCIDGDTAIFKSNKESFKARFLAIDTPETKYSSNGEQPYGKEASDYTCNKLKTAKKIELEYDDNSKKKDNYDRHLVWVWIDNQLLQKDLVSKGYAKVTYLYDNYKYTDELKKAENSAKKNNLKIWYSNNNNSNTQSNPSKTDTSSNDANIITIISSIIFIIITTLISFIKSKKKF